MNMRWWFSCFLYLICLLAFSDPWFHTPKTHPLVAAANPMQFITAPSLDDPGSFGFSAAYTSTYVYDPYILYDEFYFYLDCETFALNPYVDVKINDHAWVGMELNFLFYGAGVFDPMIEGFHYLFGFPNAGRQENPDNQLRFIIKDDENVLVDMDRGVGGLSYVYLDGGYAISLPWDIESYLIGGFKIPAEFKIPVSYGVYEATAAIALEWSYDAFTFASGASYTYQWPGDVSLNPLTLNNHLVGYSFGTAFNLGAVDLIYQIEGTNPVFYYKNHSRISRPSVRMVLGASIDIGNDMMLRISAVEEFFVFFVNADFGLACEISFL